MRSTQIAVQTCNQERVLQWRFIFVAARVENCCPSERGRRGMLFAVQFAAEASRCRRCLLHLNFPAPTGRLESAGANRDGRHGMACLPSPWLPGESPSFCSCAWWSAFPLPTQGRLQAYLRLNGRPHKKTNLPSRRKRRPARTPIIRATSLPMTRLCFNLQKCCFLQVPRNQLPSFPWLLQSFRLRRGFESEKFGPLPNRRKRKRKSMPALFP